MSQPPARIWLCADDYGISPSVNAAIRDLLALGRINATSVMVVAPSFQRAEAAALAAIDPGAGRMATGLHVTLTAPFRPLSAGFAPIAAGAFLPLAATFRTALLRRFDQRRLLAEIAAQLDAFTAAFGRAPDFVDGHQHVQLLPQVREALLTAVKARAPRAWVRQCGRVSPFHKRLIDRKGLLLDLMSRKFRARAAAHGVRTNPAFAGTYDFSAAADFTQLFPKFLDRLPGGGVVMCHPGIVDAELMRLDPLTTLREKEYAYFAGEHFPALLAAHGVTLT
jgi:chitin disaccharide deacetylase